MPLPPLLSPSSFFYCRICYFSVKNFIKLFFSHFSLWYESEKMTSIFSISFYLLNWRWHWLISFDLHPHWCSLYVYLGSGEGASWFFARQLGDRTFDSHWLSLSRSPYFAHFINSITLPFQSNKPQSTYTNWICWMCNSKRAKNVFASQIENIKSIDTRSQRRRFWSAIRAHTEAIEKRKTRKNILQSSWQKCC